MQNLENTPQEDEINILEMGYQFLGFWKWFVAGVILSLVTAHVYLRYTPKVYDTSAKIKILDDKKGGMDLSEMTSMFSGSQVNLYNEIEVLRSHRLLERVVTDLDLTTSYYFMANVMTPEIWGDKPFNIIWLTAEDSMERASFEFNIELNSGGYKMVSEDTVIESMFTYGQVNTVQGHRFMLGLVNPNAANLKGEKYKIVKKSLDRTVANLSNSLQLNPSNNGGEVLSLSLSGENNAKSEAVLNAIIDKFNEDGINDRQLVSQRTIDFVNERFVYLSFELDSIESQKEIYKQQNKLSYLEADAGMAAGRKQFAEQEYFALETQIALANLLEETLKKDKNFALLPSNIGIENQGVNTLIEEFNKAVLERSKLQISAGDKNPMVIEYSGKLAELKQNVIYSIRVLQKQLAISLANIKSLKQENVASFGRIPEKEKILRSIERQQTIKESLYLFLLQKREEASVSKAITSPSIKVVDYAITNPLPISPKSLVLYTIALTIGLLVPFGVIFLIIMLDTKIHGKQDFEKYSSKIPVVAEIPFIQEDHRIIKENDRSILAEAFRILRTNVIYLLPLDKGATAKVIYTSSSIKGEGKTFVSLNLALTYASLGKKTLLLGVDLRNPQIHKYVNMEKSRLGLSNFLYDVNVDWKTLVNPSLMDNEYFDVILAGAVPPNPAELLSNGRFEILLNLLKTEYDYIIVDTAPTILVTDTLLISQLADVTVYITRANHTDKKLLTYSKELDEKGKMKNMAYVINNVEGVSAYGYSYGYGYNYGYGYGYGEDKENVKTSTFKRFLKKWIS
jgi:tyrosine-protein kinase Etk/Wzc